MALCIVFEWKIKTEYVYCYRRCASITSSGIGTIMTKRASWLVGIVLAGLAIGAAPAQAGVASVTNGGFETGDFTGLDANRATALSTASDGNPFARHLRRLLRAGRHDGRDIADSSPDSGWAAAIRSISRSIRMAGPRAALQRRSAARPCSVLTNPAAGPYTLYSFEGVITARQRNLGTSASGMTQAFSSSTLSHWSCRSRPRWLCWARAWWDSASRGGAKRLSNAQISDETRTAASAAVCFWPPGGRRAHAGSG